MGGSRCKKKKLKGKSSEHKREGKVEGGQALLNAQKAAFRKPWEGDAHIRGSWGRTVKGGTRKSPKEARVVHVRVEGHR